MAGSLDAKTIHEGDTLNIAESASRLTGVTLALALLSIVPLSGAVAADLAKLTEECAHCHGKDGVSTEPTVPTIAGMSDFFISEAMLIYQDRDRPCVEAEYLEGPDKGSKTDMCKIADELGENEIEALAKFYAEKPFVRAKQDFDAAKAEVGAKVHDRACEKCHEDGGSVAEDDAGLLAGQWMPYLRQAFEAYDAGSRPMAKKMKPKYEDLSAEDKENLLHYYGSLQ